MTSDLKSESVFYGLMVYLFYLIIEGPIRYVLNGLGADYLIYFRDFFIIILISGYIIKSLISGKMNKIMLLTFMLLSFHTIIGLFFVPHILQVLFGLKIIMPLIMGLLVYPIFSSNEKIIIKIFIIFLVIAIIGVFLGSFKTLPWEGLTYDLGGKEIEGTRNWQQFGIKRVAGFSRSYNEVSIQILILASYLVSHLKKKSIVVPLWLLSGAAILLTMQKGIIIAYFIMSLFLIVYKVIPNFNNYYQKILIVPILIMILLPLIGYFYSSQLDSAAFLKNPVLLTFRDRIVNAWPEYFTFLQKHGDIVLGRGIGGIGTSQKFYESQSYIPGDNLFVYALEWFGIMSVIYLLYIYKWAQKIDLKDGLFYYLLLLGIILYGIVTCVLESNFLMIFLGLCLRYIWVQTFEKKTRYALVKLQGG